MISFKELKENSNKVGFIQAIKDEIKKTIKDEKERKERQKS